MFGVPELLMEVVMAIAVGGLIGIERENTPEKKYAGVRTLALLTGAGPGAVAISEKAGTPFFVGIYLVLALSLAIGVVAVRMYLEGKNIGFTTSVAVFVSAILGVMVGYDLYSEATSLAILSALILAEKQVLHGYVSKLEDTEITKALQLAAIAFILLPILPATAIDPLNAVVPREAMLLAVFVLGIEFASYVSLKQLGGSGIYLTGVLGGSASSFATTGVMSRLSRKRGELENAASAAILLATSSMMVRNIGIAAAMFVPVMGFQALTLDTLYMPVALMMLPLLAAAYLQRNDSQEKFDIDIGSPFSLRSGLKFAAIFILVSLGSVVGQQFFGSTATYTTAFLGGMASSAAVVASAASTFNAGSMSVEVASGMIMFSIAGSLLSKIVLVEMTNRHLRRKTSIPLATSAVLGLAALLVI